MVQASSGDLERVQLELGGKGANVVFEDADLEHGGRWQRVRDLPRPGAGLYRRLAAAAAREYRGKLLDHFLTRGDRVQLGSPLSPQTEIGPLTSLAHRDHVLSYCKVAREEGGEILLGGKAPPMRSWQRSYVMPTVVRARPKDRVCQEEVFGPFVTVTTFKHEDEVIAVANDTVYGLGGGLCDTPIFRGRIAWPGKSSPGWSG